MFYKNARIFCSDFQFRNGAFEVTEDGRFGQILPETVPADAIDLQGATVIPGLIDVHNHGNSGADFSDGDYAGLEAMARYLAKSGITGFAPASMTLPYEALEKAFGTAKQLAEIRPENCSRLLGIQMEGPYFSDKKKGAQNGAYLKLPDFEGFRKLYQDCGGLVKIVDVAPELPGAEEFVRKAARLCTVSIAHTDSDYDHAKAAIEAGVTHLTHLFNAMPAINHRNPGVISAAAEAPQVRAELICDGHHIHGSVVRLAFTIFGPERMILVSDALRCCGMPDGEYALGGQQVFLKGGAAKLADGTLAGSSTNLYDCMRKAMEFGISEEAAIRACSYNPACSLRAENATGSIATGHYADFIVCTDHYAHKQVFLNGKLIV